MATKYVFEVKYEAWYQDVPEPVSGCERRSTNTFDGQIAVDEVKAKVMNETLELDDEAKCIGFSLSSVENVTDYEE